VGDRSSTALSHRKGGLGWMEGRGNKREVHTRRGKGSKAGNNIFSGIKKKEDKVSKQGGGAVRWN